MRHLSTTPYAVPATFLRLDQNCTTLRTTTRPSNTHVFLHCHDHHALTHTQHRPRIPPPEVTLAEIRAALAHADDDADTSDTSMTGVDIDTDDDDDDSQSEPADAEKLVSKIRSIMAETEAHDMLRHNDATVRALRAKLELELKTTLKREFDDIVGRFGVRREIMLSKKESVRNAYVVAMDAMSRAVEELCTVGRVEDDDGESDNGDDDDIDAAPISTPRQRKRHVVEPSTTSEETDDAEVEMRAIQDRVQSFVTECHDPNAASSLVRCSTCTPPILPPR